MGRGHSPLPLFSVARDAVLEIGQMQTHVIARIYSDGSIEYNPPSDSLHPPVEGELRIKLAHDHIPHLQTSRDSEGIDLGEVTDELLTKHGLNQFSGF